MSNDRLTRVNELLRREIGLAFYHVLSDSEIDISALTVTHVQTSSNLRTARVGVSIRDHHEDRARMLSVLRRHRADIQSIISRNLVLKYTPKVNFVLDLSIEKGDHVLSLLQQLEAEQPIDGDDATLGDPAASDSREDA